MMKISIVKNKYVALNKTNYVPVFAHGNHAIAIHGLPSEELELLKPAEDILHHFIHVGFEYIYLIW